MSDLLQDGPRIVPRSPWYRRRPPETVVGFARGLWWTGHSQLFIGAGLLAIGVTYLVILGALAAGGVHFDGTSAWIGEWMLVFVAPFFASGLMLRGASVGIARATRLSDQVMIGIAAIIGIALVSFAFVCASVAFVTLVSWPIITAIQQAL